jgi:VanZ family protein
MVPNQFYIKLRNVIPYVFWLSVFVTIVLTLMPSNQIPSQIQIWDKAEHAIVFFILMFTGGVTYSKHAEWVGLALISYGTAIELAQEYLTTSRNGDKFDIVADVVGVIIGYVLFKVVYHLSHKKTTQ